MKVILKDIRTWLGLYALLLFMMHININDNEAWWGVKHFSLLGPSWKIVIVISALVAAVYFVAAGRRAAPADIENAGTDETENNAENVKRQWKKILLFTCLAVPVFWILRCYHMYGDSYVVITALEGAGYLFRREPLTLLIYHGAYNLMHPLGFWADETVTVVNCLAGGLFVGAALWWIHNITADRLKRHIWTGLILTSIVIQLCCGYIENYTFLLAGSMLLWCLIFQYLRGRIKYTYIVICFIITFLFHMSAGFLLPVILLLPFFHHERKKIGGLIKVYALLLCCLPGLLIVLYLINYFYDQDLVNMFDFSMLVPLTAEAARIKHNYLFGSAAHLGAVLQELLLIMPVAVFGILLIAGCTVRRGIFKGEKSLKILLIIGSVSYLIFCLIWHPDYGPEQDWDLFAVSALPMTLLLGLLLTTAEMKRVVMSGSAGIIIGIMLIHTWSFIVYNAEFGKRGWGSLEVTSEPPGALFIFNGRSKGESPKQMKFIRAGEYEIRLLLRDHQAHIARIEIEPGRKIWYHGDLKKNGKTDQK